jgi:hypothetical protein
VHAASASGHAATVAANHLGRCKKLIVAPLHGPPGTDFVGPDRKTQVPYTKAAGRATGPGRLSDTNLPSLRQGWVPPPTSAARTLHGLAKREDPANMVPELFRWFGWRRAHRDPSAIRSQPRRECRGPLRHPVDARLDYGFRIALRLHRRGRPPSWRRFAETHCQKCKQITLQFFQAAAFRTPERR